MPPDANSRERGTLLQCFVSVAHVANMTGLQLLICSPQSTEKPMSIGAWIARPNGPLSRRELSQPATLHWLDAPGEDGVVAYIEDAALTLHIRYVLPV
jgi:hypothetical protein